MSGDDEVVHMRVVDDGIGFVPHGSGRMFGLQIMKERASSVHGALIVHSVPGEGTTIDCTLPCLARERIRKELRLPAVEPEPLAHIQDGSR